MELDQTVIQTCKQFQTTTVENGGKHCFHNCKYEITHKCCISHPNQFFQPQTC